MITRRSCALPCHLLLGAIALLLAASSVRAEDVYPPGWNTRTMSVGPVLYDFRSGEWNDYKRYWPETIRATAGNEPSRPMSYGPLIFQMEARGERYHRVDHAPVN